MVRTLYSVYAAGPEHKSHPVALLLFFYGKAGITSGLFTKLTSGGPAAGFPFWSMNPMI